MKKIFFLLLAILLLTGCTSTKKEEIDGIKTSELKPKYATKFTYDGHQYIMFRTQGDHGGIIHDPDCPCHEVTSDY